MTDQPIGLNFQPAIGWWIATDDKWYPPELHPDYEPPIEVAVNAVAPQEAPGSASVNTRMASATAPQMHSAQTGEAPPLSEASAHQLPFGTGSQTTAHQPSVATAAPEASTRTAPARVARKIALTTWERMWYVVLCVLAGIGYFAKIPAKRAMEDYRFCRMTSAEHFWYVVMCIFFGLGYLAKIPTAKALSELPQFLRSSEPTQTEP